MLETPVAIGTEVDEKRRLFFHLLFGSAKGLLCIAFIGAQNKKDYRESFYVYPEEIDLALEEINAGMSDNVYFCPQLFRERKRTKEHVEATPNVWADLDYCNPINLLVEPTVVLESSPEKFQGFWRLKEVYDPDDVEDIAHRIAYKHADEGADRSGWDLTQLLRVPHTYNYKYVETPLVVPVLAKKNDYSLEDFDELYPKVDDYQRVDVPKPEIDPSLNADELLQNSRMTLNPHIWGLYSGDPQEGMWSQVLWKLLLLLFENGFTETEVYVIAQNAKCNKYARDGRPAYQLWKDVVRAQNKHSVSTSITFSAESEDVTKQIDLLTDEERTRLLDYSPGFVERYIEWASTTGDAAVQYHQAGALVALSALLCGNIRLPTGFGTIVPNLWFMILADTTLTRKTTAMDLCMDMVAEVDDDAIMATDGSVEGMLTSLSQRANQPSIFLRDEFGGLIEQMNKKDYMSGMAEFFTKLYDGKMQKRILRKEVVEVKNPRLIMFAGGIKEAVTSAFTREHIESGFIPRFIFITAESDVTKIKPMGPPTTKNVKGRDKLLIEMMKIKEFYSSVEEIMIPDTDSVLTRKKFFDIEMTEEAWLRYNALEAKLTDFGIKSEKKELMTPVGVRLANSILKTALLLAASRELSNNILVTELDMLKAISYGEVWFTHTRAVISRVGLGGTEKQLSRILTVIAQGGSAGVNRASLMRLFRLSSKEYNIVLQTLEFRDQVIRTAQGRGEVVRITSHAQIKIV